MEYQKLIVFVTLLLIISSAVSVRMSSYTPDQVLTQADPWYFLRRVKEIIENNYVVPEWSIQSHFPGGRPFGNVYWYEYSTVVVYLVANGFGEFSILQIAGIMPIIYIVLAIIFAYLIGNLLSNKYGGLITAFFIAFSPVILSVTGASYFDSDVIVVFYSLFCLFTAIYAFKKRSIFSYILAVASNVLFIFSWTSGFYILFGFMGIVSIFVLWNLFRKNYTETKSLTKLILCVFLPVFFISLLLGQNIFSSIFERISWFTGSQLIVNISVAELHKFNVFSADGMKFLSERIGLLPFYLFILGLPLYFAYRSYKHQWPTREELFLFLFLIATVAILTFGTRFVLMFAIISIILAGYVFGKVVEILPSNPMWKTLFFGFIITLSFVFLAVSYQTSYLWKTSQDWFNAMDWLKENADKDSLIVTWWDPGHFIVYNTDLKVHADGAQCPNYECVIYDHNVRIQDMGRIFTTDDEEEAISILEKYIQLTPEQCQEIKQRFGDIVPDDVCKPVSEMYLIASNDLIGKYYWMSFFGDCLKKFGLQSADVCYKTPLKWFEENVQGRNFIQLPLSRQDAQGNLIYGEIVTLTVKDDKIVPIINIPQQGIRNAIIKEIIYYQNGQENKFEFANVTNTMDGLLWVDPSFRIVIFMDPTIRDSVFTNMFFFNGNGDATFDIPKLNHFQLVFQNNEVKIFKVIF